MQSPLFHLHRWLESYTLPEPEEIQPDPDATPHFTDPVPTQLHWDWRNEWLRELVSAPGTGTKQLR